MGGSIFFLFALLVAGNTVSSLHYKMVLPTKAMSLHQQCAAKHGFDGECWAINRIETNPHCGPVACAASVSRGIKQQAHFLFENAPDGLRCGTLKVCYQGRCEDLPLGVFMPEQPATSFRDYRECYIVGGTNTRRT